MRSRRPILPRVLCAPAIAALVCTVLAAAGCDGEPEVRRTSATFTVEVEGTKVGHLARSQTFTADTVTTNQVTMLLTNRQGLRLPVTLIETHEEGLDGTPHAFTRIVTVPGQPEIRHEGRIDADGVLHLTAYVGDMKHMRSVPWPEDAMLMHTLWRAQEAHGWEAGTQYTLRRYDTALFETLAMDVAVGATVPVDVGGTRERLAEVTLTHHMPEADVEATVYIDPAMGLRKGIMPLMGIDMVVTRCDYAAAMAPNEAVDLAARLSVAAPEPMPDLAGGASATYRIEPTGDRTLDLPGGGAQTVAPEGEALRVTVRRASPPADGPVPWAGDDAAVREALRPSAWVQSRDKEVVRLAREAVGDAADAAEAGRRIEAFVRTWISKKDFASNWASAAEVARFRRGDCSEHALLAAAMARAAGLPARVVQGLVYAEDAGEPRFVPHAWVRIRVGEAWVDYDAALPEGFGVGHLALTVGSGDRAAFFALAERLGHLRIASVRAE